MSLHHQHDRRNVDLREVEPFALDDRSQHEAAGDEAKVAAVWCDERKGGVKRG